MKRAVTVLWEDQRSENSPRTYGPHQLLLQLVADKSEPPTDGWSFRDAVECRPVKGSGNLLKNCRKVDDIAPDCHPVVAVFDADKVRGLVRLPADRPDEEVVEAILKEASPPTNKLHVILLHPNMEAIVNAAHHAPAASCARRGGRPENPPKDRITRDRILMNAAAVGTVEIRSRIVKKVPTLGEIRDLVVMLLKAK